MQGKRSGNKSSFLVCVRNEGHPASLEQCKIYRALPDDEAAARGLVRVIDESGEDYLYPAEFFMPISLPEALRKAMLKAG